MAVRLIIIFTFLLTFSSSAAFADEKVPIKTIYIPLADHYPGIIAFEKYKNKMDKTEKRAWQTGSMWCAFHSCNSYCCSI